MKHTTILLCLALAACATTFEIDDAVFDQGAMAHSSGFGTMYLTNDSWNGTHNCDDNPRTCCAAGYHMCTLNEFRYGGREIERWGLYRDLTFYDTQGWVDGIANNAAQDCSGFTTDSGLVDGTQGNFSTTVNVNIPTAATLGCEDRIQVWCCSR